MALNRDNLEQDIEEAIHNTLPGALKQALTELFPTSSKEAKSKLDQYEKTIDEQISNILAKGIASAVHRYVSNIEVFGQIMILTSGSPVAQQAMVTVNTYPTGMPKPFLGGILGVPNSLNLGVK